MSGIRKGIESTLRNGNPSFYPRPGIRKGIERFLVFPGECGECGATLESGKELKVPNLFLPKLLDYVFPGIRKGIESELRRQCHSYRPIAPGIRKGIERFPTISTFRASQTLESGKELKAHCKASGQSPAPLFLESGKELKGGKR